MGGQGARFAVSLRVHPGANFYCGLMRDPLPSTTNSSANSCPFVSANAICLDLNHRCVYVNGGSQNWSSSTVPRTTAGAEITVEFDFEDGSVHVGRTGSEVAMLSDGLDICDDDWFFFVGFYHTGGVTLRSTNVTRVPAALTRQASHSNGAAATLRGAPDGARPAADTAVPGPGVSTSARDMWLACTAAQVPPAAGALLLPGGTSFAGVLAAAGMPRPAQHGADPSAPTLSWSQVVKPGSLLPVHPGAEEGPTLAQLLGRARGSSFVRLRLCLHRAPSEVDAASGSLLMEGGGRPRDQVSYHSAVCSAQGVGAACCEVL